MTLRSLFDKAYQSARNRAYRYGTVGKHNPDTTISYAVPGRVDYLYITLSDRTVIIARNEAGVPQTEDLQVKLRLEHGEYVIYGRSTGGALTVPDETPPDGVPTHTLGSHSDVTVTAAATGDVLAHNGTAWVDEAPIVTSAGAGDAGKLIRTDAGGQIDATLINDADINLDNVTEGTTNKFFTATEKTKLSGVEDGADVTDAANVGSAIDGATVSSSMSTTDKIAAVISGTLRHFTYQTIRDAIKGYYDSVSATLTNKTLDSTNISTLTAKTTPIDADSAVIVDSAASNVFKRVTYTNVKAFLKTYFDTLYGLLGSANTWTANNAFNSTATTGSALSATRNLTATSTDSPVLDVIQDHASDDQAAMRVRQDGTGAIQEWYDAGSLAMQLLDGKKLDIYGPFRAVGASVVPSANGSGPSMELWYYAPGPYGVLIAYDRDTNTYKPLRVVGSEIRFDVGTTGVMFLRSDGKVAIGADEDGGGMLNLRNTPASTYAFEAEADSAGRGWQIVTQDYAFSGPGSAFTFQFGGGSGNQVTKMNAYTTGKSAAGDIILNDLSGGKVIIGLTNAGASHLGIQAGTSTNDAAVGGGLYATVTQTGNVGTGEDVLASYSVPANTLSANGMSLWFEAFGTMAANGNAKTLRIRFGTSGTNLILNRTGGIQTWRVQGRIVRTGVATQKAIITVFTPSATETSITTSLDQTLSGAVTFKATGEATANNDIVLESFIVGWDDANV